MSTDPNTNSPSRRREDKESGSSGAQSPPTRRIGSTGSTSSNSADQYPSPQNQHYPPPPSHRHHSMQVQQLPHPSYHPGFPPPPRHEYPAHPMDRHPYSHGPPPHHYHPRHYPPPPGASANAVSPETGQLMPPEYFSPAAPGKRRAFTPDGGSPASKRRRPGKQKQASKRSFSHHVFSSSRGAHFDISLGLIRSHA